MDVKSQIALRKIYRVTGTPENFLTALRHRIWGFNTDAEKHWKKLVSGDILFFHSKGSDSYFVRNPKSCIIGFGVVGNNFFINNDPLWIDEFRAAKSYPYKFSFSEIYLFADIPVNQDWDSTTLDKIENTKLIVEKLLLSGIALSELQGFPIMGSYSSINDPLVKELLFSTSKNLSFYQGDMESEMITKTTELKEITTEQEALRFSTSLTMFDNIKERIINATTASKSYALDTLANAEKVHFGIVAFLLNFFKERGFKTFNNNHVDLFAYSKDTSLLVEAKSIENKNFKSQSRKGIVQLFEYNFFEISTYKAKNELHFEKEHKLLVTSKEPVDKEYIQFINSLDIKTACVEGGGIHKYGQSIDFENIC